jgi:hypothetical protein
MTFCVGGSVLCGRTIRPFRRVSIINPLTGEAGHNSGSGTARRRADFANAGAQNRAQRREERMEDGD